jgi:hypothetical protein
MSSKVGDRVAAIRNADETTVYLYGYGVYDGYHDNEIVPGVFTPNPRITLDDGQIIWGSECWWGAEEITKEKFKGKAIEVVPI